MKFFLLFLLIASIYSTTYFGEFFECGIYDKCLNEYKTCQGDTKCNYNMYSSPCIDKCGVNYQKFFEEIRTYDKTFNNQELLAIFPQAGCDFDTCQAAWLQKMNNSNLTALKKCEMEKCEITYPTYTFISHLYKELKQCQVQLKQCIETDPQCQKEVLKANKCIKDKGLAVEPTTTPDKYFKEPISGFMGAIENCYPDPKVVQIDDYTKLMDCLAQVWNN